jgi:hypothetical protein
MEHRWNEIVLGEKPVPVPLCPPQIPHGLTRDRTQASAVGGRRLTAWAMARPCTDLVTYLSKNSSFDVKRQGDFGDFFVTNTSLMRRKIGRPTCTVSGRLATQRVSVSLGRQPDDFRQKHVGLLLANCTRYLLNNSCKSSVKRQLLSGFKHNCN